MMEYVVYVLGAGFSAPLGLPVTTNFIESSKDLYFGDSRRFASFLEVFELIDKMSRVALVYKSDLHNIEEVLSILEMQEHLSETPKRERFINYIREVISALSPDFGIAQMRRMSANWQRSPFPQRHEYYLYSLFVASVLNLEFISAHDDSIQVARSTEQNISYSFITLNYDLVLEDLAKWFGYAFNRGMTSTDMTLACLAKLHGSIDLGEIAPPTWNKSLTGIQSEWKLAFDLLARAHHIRFVGYSLPAADAYVRFLLKSSVIRSTELLGTQHLKSIDVICLDQNGEVRKRFDEFVIHPKYRFFNRNVLAYLELLHKALDARVGFMPSGSFRVGELIEDGHRYFVDKYS